MLLIPFTLDSMPSSRLVTSVSTTLAELPGIVKKTESPGILREGDSFTGKRGASANPTSDRHTNVTIKVKDDHVAGCLFSFSLIVIQLSSQVIEIKTFGK